MRVVGKFGGMMPLFFVLCILTGFQAETHAQGVNLLGKGGYPSFRGNNQNTGLSPYLAKKPTHPVWTIAVDGEFYAPPSMGPDGTIYAGGTDDVLYALRPNGSIVFTRKISRSTFFIPFSTPTIGPDGTIYIGCRDWTLRSFHPNGDTAMVYHVDEMVRTGPLIAEDGTLFFGTGNAFYAYDRYDNPLWMRKFERLIYPLPVLTSDRRLLFTDGRHKLYCLNSLNGSTLWEFKVDGFISDYPMALPDGRVVITCHSAGENLLYIMDARGEIGKAFSLSEWLPYTPVLGPDGTLYVASFSGYVYAIDSEGKSKWKFRVPLSFPPAMTVDPAGTLLIGGLDGYLYAIGRGGDFLWKYDIGSPIHAAPLIGPGGRIYISTVDGILYALD